MKVKKPGELVYWVEEHFHIIGEVSDKYLGWYDIRRSVSLSDGIKIVKFEIDPDKEAHKSAVKEVPDWLTKEIFKRIFKINEL